MKLCTKAPHRWSGSSGVVEGREKPFTRFVPCNVLRSSPQI